ncbi:uncharacterized protein LOC133896667 [Phragmites australis]|uniref:uncharacterized protein LOC133896667 n=1 Tax=Phragmites australis TaxID=29695 RepID=UPI002D786675|nr:uncharacterized protein LOC133896667 [Phragmites australis]
MSAVAPRVAGAARRLSQSRKPAGGREKELSPAPHEEAAVADKAKKRTPAAVTGVPSILLRRQELLLRRGGVGGRSGNVHPPSSLLSVSCASEASTGSFCSRASTGRIGRLPAGPPGGGAVQRRAAGPPSARPAIRKPASVVPDGAAAAAVVLGSVNGEAATAGPPRCTWVTPNTDPCYAAFHDQEWGVPVHDDKKLFEMLVLSGALAEMTWPVILSKRDTFREVFMDFDLLLVAKLNERKILGPCSPASSLLSEHRLRIIIENARELLKVIEDFGSFNNYCWSFLNDEPLIGRFRHTREVPLRTPKAEAISQDLMRRGFRGVGPTVVYAFMQAVGMANDHLVTCYRFQECCTTDKPAVVSDQEVSMVCGLVQCVGLEPTRAATVISIS